MRWVEPGTWLFCEGECIAAGVAVIGRRVHPHFCDDSHGMILHPLQCSSLCSSNFCSYHQGAVFCSSCTFLKLFSWCPSPLLQPPHLVSLQGENKLESVQQRRKEKQDWKKKHSPCWPILCRIMILKKKGWGLVTVCSGEVSVAISCRYWTRWLVTVCSGEVSVAISCRYWTQWLLCSHWLVMGSNTFFMLFYQKNIYLRLIEIIQWLFQCALFVTNDSDVLFWVKLKTKFKDFFIEWVLSFTQSFTVYWSFEILLWFMSELCIYANSLSLWLWKEWETGSTYSNGGRFAIVHSFHNA